MKRIGVFVCHCGSNIAATVDVKKVVEMALLEQGVVHAEDYPYMCSEAGQSRIAAAVADIPGVIYIRGYDFIPQDTNILSDFVTHPNDEGFA